MPLSVGTALKNLRNASRSPADAPIPTSASLRRPADATLAAPGAFRVVVGCPLARPSLVARVRPRPIHNPVSRQPRGLSPGTITPSRHRTSTKENT